LKLKILITGANGTLAKEVIPLIKEKNHEIFGIVKKNPEKKFIRGDIRNFKSIQSIIVRTKPDIIIHTAGLTGNIECQNNPIETFRTNVLGTFNVLLSSIRYKPKIIFTSSREVYGNNKRKSIECDLMNPINLNGLSKMLSEELIINFNKNYQIPYNILRFTNFYSETGVHRGISVLIKNAFTSEPLIVYGGGQEIDLIHINDAARAVIKCIDYKKSDVFNIGSGKSITVKKLLQIIEKISKKKIKYLVKPYRQFEVKDFAADIEKARKLLKFQPSISIEEGIKRFSNQL
jgi:nucleoside-diphosphate-sugar epimerase